MKHKKQILSNISPENRLTLKEKLEQEGVKFQTVLLHKYKGRIGVFCPFLMDTFVIKQYCKKCNRWLGSSGKFYLCKNK